MSKIETLVLRACDPEAQCRFYRDILGMDELCDETVGYGGEEAKIRFSKAEGPYDPKPDDVYWKIALAVPDIELACRQLTARGVDIGKPRQFQDVGFLAHFSDPEGFTIELIEHWFKGNRQAEEIEDGALGGGAHFNLLTLRTADIAMVQRACASWRMTPLSIQPVESHGFTLHFYAFTSHAPPSPDLYAVENREWLYQRKYTVLEVQHVHAAATMALTPVGNAGYAGTVFSGEAGRIHNRELMINRHI